MPWYREPWPWLLAAGPAIVVVASLATTLLAIRSDDGVVAGDYYKRGLLVNQRLPKVAAIEAAPTAAVSLGDAGELRVRLAQTALHGETLRVTLYHPASATRETATLVRDASGDYAGLVHADRRGAWTVAFDPDLRLPTTIVERRAAASGP